MRILDIVKISQKNLLRAKLRTFLTVAAVFIGALTLSLTNGLGNGVKAYVNSQVGNLGAENTLLIQAKQTSSNPTSTDVVVYNPDRETSGFNITLVNNADVEKIKNIPGILKVTPAYDARLEYISLGSGIKFEATAQQYIEGLNLEMAAGRTVNSNADDEISIPNRYIKSGTEQETLGRVVIIGYKDATGKIIEKNVKIVGVQQQSLLGNSGVSISGKLAQEISDAQTTGIPALSGKYQAVIAEYDKNYSADDLTALKNRLDKAGYSGQTLQDQIGTIGTVINGILVVLNVFAAVTLLAAAFGIINTLLMSVNERTSEIGLMKSLGANRKTIFSIFAFEAASIGFWGALIGVGLSIGIGAIASRIASHTFLKNFVGFKLLAFPVLPSLAVLGGIIVLSFIAGALPSLKASKLDPIKALRYE